MLRRAHVRGTDLGIMREILILCLSLSVVRAQQKGVSCSFSEDETSVGEKQVRVAEDTPTGTEIFTVRAFPRRSFSIQALDGSRADGYFTYREVDRRHVAIILSRSIQDLTDQSKPTSDIRFRLACRGRDDDTVYLPVTVFIQDINDNPPVFQSGGYNVSIEENTPVGLTIFRGIQAIDRDMPNTPNSHVTYSIVSGNEDKKFSIEGSGKAVVVLRKKLDFEAGDTLFNLTVLAQDQGVPPLSASSSLLITVRDVDDMNPAFTHSVYRIQIPEDNPADPPTTAGELRRVDFSPPIRATDQDIGILAPLEYRISAGNELQYFELDKDTGQLFLAKPIDRELLDTNRFYLDIVAFQKDNELKAASAALEIEILDLNDNRPEFEVERYNMTVIESLPAGFRIMQFTAVDRDQGANAKFSYRLEDPSGAFSLQPEDGQLILARPELFDRERMESVVVRVIAEEREPSVLPPSGGSSSSSVDVEIHLLDANDNNPVFLPSNVYVFQVDEAITTTEVGSGGVVVGRVQATDPDLGPNGFIKYQIKNATELLASIQLDPVSGEIRLTSRQTKEKKISFFVEAVDQPEKEEERRSAIAVVELQFPESGEKATFIGAPYEWWLDTQEGLEEGRLVGVVRSTLTDTEATQFSLRHNYNTQVPFEIDPTSGIVTVGWKEEGEGGEEGPDWKTSYSLQVAATDGQQEILAPLVIRLSKGEAKAGEKEEEVPKILELTVKENIDGALVGNLSHLMNERKRGTEHLITSEEARQRFLLTEAGLLYTSGALDREERDSYMFTILLGRKGLPRGFRGQQAIQVKVRVEDENDNSPVFEQHIYQGHVQENSKIGTEVVLARKLAALDSDLADRVRLELYGKDSERFRLDPDTGKVFLADGIQDREDKEVYYLRLRAVDMGGNVGEAQLVIHVTDRNDHQPRFLKLQVLDSRLVSVAKDKVWVGEGVGAPVLDMAETVPPGTRIARVLAEDRDAVRTGGLTYSLISEEAAHIEPRKSAPAKDRFYVEEATGDILVKRQVEAKTSYILNISAQDEGGLSTITQIILRVNDINNNRPVFDSNHYSFQIQEGDYFNTDVGAVHAEDEDFYDNGLVTYAIVEMSGEGAIFAIDSKSGALTVSGLLDRETVEAFELVVEAADHGERKLTSRVNVTVEVLDANDNQPIFYGYDRLAEGGGFHTVPVYTANLPVASLEAGVRVAEILANDTDEVATGNGAVEFRLLDNKNSFYIHPETGVVTTLITIDRNYNITVEAADHGKPVRSATALIHILLIPQPPPSTPPPFEALTSPSQQSKAQPPETGATRSPPPPPPTFAGSQAQASSETPQSVPSPAEQPRLQSNNGQVSTKPSPGISGPIVASETNGTSYGGGLFKKEAYTVQVVENVDTPVVVLSMARELVSVGAATATATFRIVGSNYGMFHVGETSGDLVLTASPDREERDIYILRIKVSVSGSGKKVPLFFYTLYLEGEGSQSGGGGPGAGGHAEGEAIVRVSVLDINDNVPEFLSPETMAAVPATAEYGHHVVKLEARDKDSGDNGEVVYSLEPADRFSVEPTTGEVVAVSSFLGQAGTIYTLTAVARDRAGKEGSLAATSKLVIAVVSPELEVLLLLEQPQPAVEAGLKNLTASLSALAGFPVSTSGLRAATVGQLTEVRLFGIRAAALVKAEELRERLAVHSLERLAVREVTLAAGDKEAGGLGSVEVAVLTIACLVFLGAFIAVLCICCIKLRRSQKHYPAPLAIPLPNYSYDQAGKEMLERQASQRFGTIPRVSTVSQQERGGRAPAPRSCHLDSSEDDAYHAKSSLSTRGAERRSQQSRHSTPTHRKSTRSVHEAKSSGESSRSRDSGIDDNRDCCSCRQSSVSSRESTYAWAPPHCARCCGCPAGQQLSRRHRSSSPARRSCSLRPRCPSHRSLPRHAHSHHDLRPESDSETESDNSQGRRARSGSGRRPLYTAELWSRSLTPSQSEARLSQAELRLASTTAARGHSWRGETRPQFQIEKKFLFVDREQASANLFGKSGDKSISSNEGNSSSLRRSARKSNLKATAPSRGTTAKNNAAV